MPRGGPRRVHRFPVRPLNAVRQRPQPFSIVRMTAASRCRRRASIVALMILALLWHALLPLAATAMPPRATVTLCTALGVRVVAVDADLPSNAQASVDHCPLCRLASDGNVPLPACGWHVGQSAAPAHAVFEATAHVAGDRPWSPGAPRAPPSS